ncbi:MAG: ABC transporter ATP-binding protein [Deltaproteobacteria bacterium]|jgi:oligopeptide/dipeptide ABC transporter ATP-binding protein|nr:ABC transporter ATP-binding protein [Deltaproteobacteria bacterium]
MNNKLLVIEELRVSFDLPEGVARAVDGVSFYLAAGETLGLVGESGCGKSVTALSILGLVPSPPGRIDTGRIEFENQDLLRLEAEGLRRIRGRDISMIFQEPMTSLNPVLPIGQQVAEPLRFHKALSKSAALAEAAEWLDHVKIPAARKRLYDYPHQLSGGMRQRVMIAMAMVCRPKLLIADEPTTALDVTIQAQILSLMLNLKSELNMSVLLITHDLGVVAQMASRVVVMYAGQVVEEGRMTDIFDQPFHPYTQGLLKSMPRLGDRRGGHTPRLSEIPGTVPALIETVVGCRFADRCPHSFEACRRNQPELFKIGNGQRARCWLQRHPDRRKPSA